MMETLIVPTVACGLTAGTVELATVILVMIVVESDEQKRPLYARLAIGLFTPYECIALNTALNCPWGC